MKYKHLSYSDRQEMEKLYLQGWHMNDIAEKLGVSLATVYHERARGDTGQMQKLRRCDNLHSVLLGLAAGIGGGVSMAQIVTAQFVGQTSCGFVREKYYEIEISAGRSGCLCVQDVQGQGFCPYSTLAALRKNWKIINNEKTPGGEPGRNEAGYERGYFDPR